MLRNTERVKAVVALAHIIGLPKKDGKRLPMFDYEGLLYKSLTEPGYLNSNPSGTLARPS